MTTLNEVCHVWPHCMNPIEGCDPTEGAELAEQAGKSFLHEALRFRLTARFARTKGIHALVILTVNPLEGLIVRLPGTFPPPEPISSRPTCRGSLAVSAFMRHFLSCTNNPKSRSATVNVGSIENNQ